MTTTELTIALRSDATVVSKMAPSADKMEADAYADKHANFIINRILITREDAQQVCIQLWKYYRELGKKKPGGD